MYTKTTTIVTKMNGLDTLLALESMVDNYIFRVLNFLLDAVSSGGSRKYFRGV